MQKITDIKFISLEFDLGYSPDDEESIENKGNIHSEVFVEIDYDGEISVITHKIKLHETDLIDFMEVEDKEELIWEWRSLMESVGHYEDLGHCDTCGDHISNYTVNIE